MQKYPESFAFLPAPKPRTSNLYIKRPVSSTCIINLSPFHATLENLRIH